MRESESGGNRGFLVIYIYSWSPRAFSLSHTFPGPTNFTFSLLPNLPIFSIFIPFHSISFPFSLDTFSSTKQALIFYSHPLPFFPLELCHVGQLESRSFPSNYVVLGSNVLICRYFYFYYLILYKICNILIHIDLNWLSFQFYINFLKI